jgi:putative sterol carrier protein
MSEECERFFADLSRHGHERVLRKTSGGIRFDLEHDGGVDQWYVVIDRGQVHATREERPVDCVIRTDTAFFERMVRGERRPRSAWLRNDIASEGRFRFVVLLDRLFPGPPGAWHPREFARAHGRRE